MASRLRGKSARPREAHVPTGRDTQAAHAAAYFALLCVGLYSTSFGPALPVIARRAAVDLDTAGLIFTALFAGSISASSLVATRLRRRDPGSLSTAGLILVSAGLATIGVASTWPVVLASSLLLGAGDGLIVAAGHTLIAETAEDVTAGLSRLNIYFAFGAIAGPLWAGAVLELWDSVPVLYIGIAVVTLAAAGMMFATGRGIPVRRAPPQGAATGRLSRLVLRMGLLLFLYVGAEFGLGSWVASYSEDAVGAGMFEGAAVTSLYWGALAIGRIVSGQLFARGASAQRVLLIALAGALVSSGVLVATTGSFAFAAAAAFATGLCFGPIWACAMAIAADGGERQVPAAMVTIGNAGGLLFPWLQGAVLVSGSATAGIAVTWVLCAAMLAVAAVSVRHHGG
ncbi:hypothetical protein AYO38_11665 [bacterium SCGC AG-212-C10]|nr:hypothetical protein AYO38_11665 [bacterium SCGC AG-212-C10]